MRAADLFVLGSHREGCSSALVEAMATGLTPLVNRHTVIARRDGQRRRRALCGRAAIRERSEARCSARRQRRGRRRARRCAPISTRSSRASPWDESSPLRTRTSWDGASRRARARLSHERSRRSVRRARARPLTYARERARGRFLRRDQRTALLEAHRRGLRRLAEAPARAPGTPVYRSPRSSNHAQTWPRDSPPPRPVLAAGAGLLCATVDAGNFAVVDATHVACARLHLERHAAPALSRSLRARRARVLDARRASAVARATARRLRRRERQRRAAHGRERNRQEHTEHSTRWRADCSSSPRTARSSQSTTCA